MNMKNTFLLTVIALICIVSPSLAQDTKPAADGDKASLANQATNPAAPLIQFRFAVESIYNWRDMIFKEW